LWSVLSHSPNLSLGLISSQTKSVVWNYAQSLLVDLTMLHIGIDDTDSKEGMCTTYIGAVIVDRLKEINVRLDDYPRLVRLNPNWPLKTRGNCAVAIRVSDGEGRLPEVKGIVLETVGSLAELDHDTTNPGVVFYEGAKIPVELEEFSKKVICDVTTIKEAEKLAHRVGAEAYKFKLGRGIIGALAAIGENLDEDRTYELLAYRIPENWGMERRIDLNSVFEMDAKTGPETFDNVDRETGEVRIAPHTPCPVLYGIRAEKPESAEKAHSFVKALEPIERWVIYKTNQATDHHLRTAKICEAKPYTSVILEGFVSSEPMVLPGGHVIFRLKDSSGEICCAAYEPTRGFTKVIRKLREGDKVMVYGGVKQKPNLPLTVNLEKIRVLNLKTILRKVNPTCPKCGKKAKSEGRNKGYVCRKCKTRFPAEAARNIECPRDISCGYYEVPPRARRHIAKPIQRLPELHRVY